MTEAEPTVTATSVAVQNRHLVRTGVRRDRLGPDTALTERIETCTLVGQIEVPIAGIDTAHGHRITGVAEDRQPVLDVDVGSEAKLDTVANSDTVAGSHGDEDSAKGGPDLRAVDEVLIRVPGVFVATRLKVVIAANMEALEATSEENAVMLIVVTGRKIGIRNHADAMQVMATATAAGMNT